MTEAPMPPTLDEIDKVEEVLEQFRSRAQLVCAGMEYLQQQDTDYGVRVVGLANALDNEVPSQLHSFFAAVAVDLWAQEREKR